MPQIASPPIQLLVSVRNADEAAEAVAGGADWIDIKEPRHGALGRANWDEVSSVSHSLDLRYPLSLALGELRDWQADSPELTRLPANVSRVKVGLAGSRSQDDWPRQLAVLASSLPNHASLVAVQYADWATCGAPSPDELLEAAVQLQCPTLLVDTFDKKAGRLFDCLEPVELKRWFTSAHQHSMTCVAAGSLQADDFAAVAKLGADIVAVRGAACEAQCRTSPVSAASVAKLRSQLDSDSMRRACDEACD